MLVATAAVRPAGQWRWDVLIASALGVALLHAAGNLLNDYFDFRRGVDRRDQDDATRPGRLLVRGRLRPRDVLIEALVCLGLVAPVGVYLLARCGWGLLGFGLAGAAAGYAYTGPPFKLKYRALGEVLIFAVYGPLLVLGAAYAQTGAFEATAAYLSIPIGLATTAILAANNVRDAQEDRIDGVVTIGHLAGGRFARGLYVVLVLGCVGTLAGYAVGGVLPGVVVASPALLLLLARPLGCVWHGRRLADIDARTARFEAALLGFLFLALTVRGASG